MLKVTVNNVGDMFRVFDLTLIYFP